MILHRVVFQAKMGKSDEVVAGLKAAVSQLPEEQLKAFQPRILTDISGPFFTVVMETVHESLATYEQWRNMMFSQERQSDQSEFSVMDLVESGRNEYYTIEM